VRWHHETTIVPNYPPSWLVNFEVAVSTPSRGQGFVWQGLQICNRANYCTHLVCDLASLKLGVVADCGVRRSRFVGPHVVLHRQESVTMVASDGPSQASFHDLETHRTCQPSPSCTSGPVVSAQPILHIRSGQVSSALIVSLAKIWKVETHVTDHAFLTYPYVAEIWRKLKKRQPDWGKEPRGKD
jgi:hypothetical protein